MADNGVVTLDTLAAQLDDGLIDDEEEEVFEEELSILDMINERPVFSSDEPETVKETSSVLEEDIESIVETVKAEEGKSPIIMVTDQEDEEENISVRFLQPGQVPGVQGGPIVVINIHADSLGLGGREGELDISQIRNKIKQRTKSTPALLEESISTMLDENITEEQEEEEEEEEEENDEEIPDYLDFDTDYITITMEAEYPDFR